MPHPPPQTVIAQAPTMVQRFPRGHLKDNEHTYIFSKIPLMIKGLVVALLMLNYKWPISRFSYFNHSKQIWRCSKLLISSFPHSNQSNKNLETLYIANLQISQFLTVQQNFGMSLKRECNKKFKVKKNVTQNGMSLKMECHSNCNVSQNRMSLKMQFYSKCNVTQN